MTEEQARREYRLSQFEQLQTEYSEFLPKIKIIKPDGETKWIDITEDELARIRAILIKGL